jgi:hypothetical protein
LLRENSWKDNEERYNKILQQVRPKVSLPRPLLHRENLGSTTRPKVSLLLRNNLFGGELGEAQRDISLKEERS